MSAVAVAMPISQSSKTFADVGSKMVSIHPPVSLFLNDGSGQAGDNTGVGGGRVERKKKRRAADARVKKFLDLYETTGESLGEGSFGHVTTYRNILTNKEFAVKVIEKNENKRRHRVLKEIEIFHHCQGHENILQMVEYFEEDDKFYMVFEKMEGGTLLDCIRQRGHLTEQEASLVVRDIARGLNFLHKKGIAHRDLKPENILCVRAGQLTPVKICDFDLGSGIQIGSRRCTPVTTPELLSPVGSADFMAPEVVDVWQYQAWSYDKRCDLWSLGTILYILLCGYRPFYAHCGKDCGFDEGRACEDCQELLFKCIQQGYYSFPEPDWSSISSEAKDLIQHLLVKNPYQRYTAEQVLKHPWISKETSRAQLATPLVLNRNNSVRELGVFAETANAVNRLIQRHMSINEACPPSSYLRDNYDDGSALVDSTTDDTSVDSVLQPDDGGVSICEDGMFHLGLSEEDEDDIGFGRWSEEDEEGERECVEAISWTRLSTPGGSSLAKRRAFKMQHASESSVDSGNLSGCSLPE